MLRAAAAACRWFPGVRAAPTLETAEGLGAWLLRNQAAAHVQLSPTTDHRQATAILRALPANAISSLAAHNLMFTALPQLPAATSLAIRLGSALQGWADLARCFPQLRCLDCTSRALEMGDPAGLSSLSALTSFRLVSPVPPADLECLLGSLPQLRRLSLAATRLRSLPRTLSTLTALTYLLLRHPWGRDGPFRGWEHLAPLRQLEQLALVLAGVDSLAPVLAGLASLTRLCLTNNPVSGAGFQHLPPSLKSLQIRGARLATVPEQLTALTALEELALPSNHRLAAGWARLGQLTQLRRLDISRTGLAWECPELDALRAAGCQVVR
ncbi:hypothetical protein ABPG75_007565 [Micractinium tetrahymenae]